MALAAYTLPSDKKSYGGVKAIYITSNSLDYTITSGSLEITAIAGTGTIYKYEMEQDAAGLNANASAPLTQGANGSFFTPSISGRFVGITSATLQQLYDLSTSRGLAVFVETQNDDDDANGASFLVYGINNEMVLTAGDVQSGTALNDLSGLPFTLSGVTKVPAYALDGQLSDAIGGSVTISES